MYLEATVLVIEAMNIANPNCVTLTKGFLELLDNTNQKILENQKKICKDIDELKKSFDRQRLRQFRLAIENLESYLNSDVKEQVGDRLEHAQNTFIELTHLDKTNFKLSEASEEFIRYLITVGYIGQFNYFNSKGDARNAAIKVYECVEKWEDWKNPLVGLQQFPTKLFNQDYGQLISEKLTELKNTECQLQEISQGNALELKPFLDSFKESTLEGTKFIDSTRIELGELLIKPKIDLKTLIDFFLKQGKTSLLQSKDTALELLEIINARKKQKHILEEEQEKLKTELNALYSQLKAECQAQKELLKGKNTYLETD
jgi:hypothetical protein